MRKFKEQEKKSLMQKSSKWVKVADGDREKKRQRDKRGRQKKLKKKRMNNREAEKPGKRTIVNGIKRDRQKRRNVWEGNGERKR